MNRLALNGKNVAVIGRSGSTDEGRWLTEDTCDGKLETNGFVWPTIIWVECCYQPAPEPPSGSLVLDESVLIEKLARLRKSTTLGMRRIYGVVGSGEVKETWAVVYGKVEMKEHL